MRVLQALSGEAGLEPTPPAHSEAWIDDTFAAYPIHHGALGGFWVTVKELAPAPPSSAWQGARPAQ